MTNPIARDPMYRRRSFDADIIEVCVRCSITYRLCYRDLVAMMAERGVEVFSHPAILRWVVRFFAIAGPHELSTAQKQSQKQGTRLLVE